MINHPDCAAYVDGDRAMIVSGGPVDILRDATGTNYNPTTDDVEAFARRNGYYYEVEGFGPYGGWEAWEAIANAMKRVDCDNCPFADDCEWATQQE